MAITSLSLNNLIFFVALGLAPSAIWLWYYIQKDDHPEPKSIILKTFIYGFISTFAAFGIEFIFMKSVMRLSDFCPGCKYNLPQLLGFAAGADFFMISFTILIVLAYIEEAIKYIAAKSAAIKSRAFDEPVDAMIYLITAALGFAAAENIGYIMQDAPHAIGIAYFRFLSSTFVHVLASAVVGYFLAYSIVRKKNRAFYAAIGLGIATTLHTLFNFFIILSERNGRFIFLTALLLAGASVFVSYLFVRVKKMSFNEPIDAPRTT